MGKPVVHKKAVQKTVRKPTHAKSSTVVTDTLHPLVVKIDISDWRDDSFKDEAVIDTARDVAALAESVAVGTTPLQKATRAAAVVHALGLVPERYLPEDKLMYYVGAYGAVSARVSGMRREFETKSGKKYSVRLGVAPVPDREDGDDGEADGDGLAFEATSPIGKYSDEDAGNYVSIDGDRPEALQRSLDYLDKRIPGYVFGRLKIVAACGGDVRGAADVLKARIDELVEKLQ